MTVAELNKKVDILEKMVHNDGEMINKLRQITELQEEQIKRLEKSIDVLYDKALGGKTKLRKKEDDKVITISKQEFMEKAAAIGADMLNNGEASLISTIDFTMAAATMAFYLFDKEEVNEER